MTVPFTNQFWLGELAPVFNEAGRQISDPDAGAFANNSPLGQHFNTITQGLNLRMPTGLGNDNWLERSPIGYVQPKPADFPTKEDIGIRERRSLSVAGKDGFFYSVLQKFVNGKKVRECKSLDPSIVPPWWCVDNSTTDSDTFQDPNCLVNALVEESLEEADSTDLTEVLEEAELSVDTMPVE